MQLICASSSFVTCRLANLGDLKQEDPYVSQQLINWMVGLQKEYAFDGVRIDTVPYVNQTFWYGGALNIIRIAPAA